MVSFRGRIFSTLTKGHHLFILIDTDDEGLKPYLDHVESVSDGLEVRSLKDSTPYYYDGSYHIVDTLSNTGHGKMSRWKQLVWASAGARVFSDTFDSDSPIYAGPLPEPDKIRKVTVDASVADTRSSLFLNLGVDYIGRTKVDPRNVFVLDFDESNPLMDPVLNPELEKLYDSLPDDWWISCGFVSAASPEDLEKFFDTVPTPIPLAYTNGSRAKLRFLGLDFVDVNRPDGTERYGIDIRDRANRLSYELSEPEELPVSNFKYVI